MRIYKMTATFGKLEHETLTLEPGLNVITAPNEWGKSTWCAFLVAMLYGLDTRAKTTKTALADKDRYAPWSGSPMSGSIELNWKGRDITIERSTKRRVPLGEFKAYETKSGLPVPELTAANCGQLLLGVEQTVFRRAGFIRHADLPVTQDEALRRRLNALVTTGDESGAADRLADQLKELKNRCRYNRSGLLPQAEAERDALEEKLAELETISTQSQKLTARLEELKNMLLQLKNHQQALAYAKAQADLARVAAAREQMERTAEDLNRRETECRQLPPKEDAQAQLQELLQLRQLWETTRQEERFLPKEPQRPQLEEPFRDMTREEAAEMLLRDIETYQEATKTKAPLALMAMGILGLAVAGVLMYLLAKLYAAIAGAAGVIALVWGVFERITTKRRVRELVEKYGTDSYKRWAVPLREYEAKLDNYQSDMNEYLTLSRDWENRMTLLREKKTEICGDESIDATIALCQRIIGSWDGLSAARKDAAQARSHHETLAAMVKPVEKPEMPDVLTLPEGETGRLLTECAAEQQRLQNRLGQYQGRMETLGDRETLTKQRDRQLRRIAKLEDTYAALTIAQDTLAQARAELQRRFAPRITKRAQKLLAKMTAGRYNGLTMGQDFSLQARAGEEDVLHDALWRSDGTMDQLYLALRLAVAEELTPNAPLILDDALVRFDDQRMQAAVEILKDMAASKQVICFTCQGREAEA